jgi:DNA-binding beta-propeller fold protein YncE
MKRTIARGASALTLLAVVGGGTLAAQETARWYIGTYSNDLLVWDEASEQIVDRIGMNNFIPSGITVSESQNRLYVREARAETIEIVDLERNAVIDEFTLSERNVTVRINSFAPHPSDEKAVLFVRRHTKLRDRYVVEGPFILEYDLRSKQVTDTIPWPDGQKRENVSFRYSPDGETLYFFTDHIIAVDADTYEEVDRWKISDPLEPGLGRTSFGTNSDTYDEPGVATSPEKEVDFFTVGPSESMRGFALAPGGKKAYSLLSLVGRYEFWEFDLETRRVSRQQPFAGRPRMGIRVSADGEKLYIFVAGNTIDIYDIHTFEYLRSVTLDEDMTGTAVIPMRRGPQR